MTLGQFMQIVQDAKWPLDQEIVVGLQRLRVTGMSETPDGLLALDTGDPILYVPSGRRAFDEEEVQQ